MTSKKGKKSVSVALPEPKGLRQRAYLKALKRDGESVVIGIGPAGTGKTFLAAAVAATDLHNERIDKIVITRPMVRTDEGELDIGALPGTLDEKISAWARPVVDNIREHVQDTETVARWLKHRQIEAIPSLHLRGLSLHRTAILADEAQNFTIKTLEALLTRAGRGSRVFLTGSLEQIDREESGLAELVRMVDTLGLPVEVHYLDRVIRGEVCAMFVQAFTEWRSRHGIRQPENRPDSAEREGPGEGGLGQT